MAKGAGKAIAGIITLIIGGTVYSVSQSDVVSNFSAETGMSQKEAEAYVENIPEDELVPFDVLGEELIIDGQEVLALAAEIDCVNYYYEWETDSLSCDEGKSQFRQFGEGEIALGQAYQVLSSDSASKDDIRAVIWHLDKMNENYNLEIIVKLMDYADRDEAIKTNLYNKALLQAALQSE